MSFTDGKRWVATEKDVNDRWGLNGDGFRCGLCGHRFQVGDGVRWQYAAGTTVEIDGATFGTMNLKVCDNCDGPDVLDKWIALHKEFFQPKFWQLRG